LHVSRHYMEKMFVKMNTNKTRRRNPFSTFLNKILIICLFIFMYDSKDTCSRVCFEGNTSHAHKEGYLSHIIIVEYLRNNVDNRWYATRTNSSHFTSSKSDVMKCIPTRVATSTKDGTQPILTSTSPHFKESWYATRTNSSHYFGGR
jgi:hypothetical protein